MHVDAVRDRTAQTFLIAGDRGFSARAGSGGVAVVATRTRVARCDQHEFGRKAERLAGSGDGHHAIVYWLAHDLGDTAVRLIEDDDPSVSRPLCKRTRPSPGR